MNKKTFIWDFFWSRSQWISAHNDLIVPVGRYSRKLKNENGAWESLRTIFKLDESVHAKYNEAVSGFEGERICQLNSSALLPFLYFCNVSRDNPVSVTELGDFTEIHFEVLNSANENTLAAECKHHRPVSHVDVVLRSNDRNTLLVLESKFTEYIEHQSRSSVNVSARAYKNFYSQVFGTDGTALEKEGIVIVDGSNWECKDKRPHYLKGLAQTISHYMGLKGDVDQRLKGWLKNHTKVYLAEVLFDFESTTNGDGREIAALAKDDYCRLHKALSKRLNACRVGGLEFNVVEDLLTYQRNFSMKKMKEEVRSFYGL